MRPLFLLAILLLCGCAAPQPPAFRLPDTPSVMLNASDVRILSRVMAFDKLPHIERSMPHPPEAVLRSFVRQRFLAAAESPLTAVVTLEEASLTQRESPQKWYVFNNTVYELTYRVRLGFWQDGREIYHQTVGGFEKESLPSKSSLSAKETLWQHMLGSMVEKLGGQIATLLPPEFGRRLD